MRIFDNDAVAVEKQSRPAGKIPSEDLIPQSARLAVLEVLLRRIGLHCSIARSTSAQIACPATMWIC